MNKINNNEERYGESHTFPGSDPWHVIDVIDYGSQKIINGLPQFGFHDHTGACYIAEYHRNFIGLLENGGAAWTAGEADPGLAPVHFSVSLTQPKYISRAFQNNTLLVSEDRYIYQMDLSTNCFIALIDKEKAGIVDIGNCIYDHSDDIWVNDVRGFRIFHFSYDGTLIETIGKREADFQKGTVPFHEAGFHWIYDMRLGQDGNLYVLDSRNYAVRKIDPKAETVTTICGDGVGGYCGDGGDARYARLGTNPTEVFDGPWSLSVDEDNNIIIGDTYNRAVRVIQSGTNIITTIADDSTKTADGRSAGFEKICGMDYWNGRLYIPDWKEQTPNICIILQNKSKIFANHS